MTEKSQQNKERRQKLTDELIESIIEGEETNTENSHIRDRGDILISNQGKSANIAVTSTGTGLNGQEKTPKDLRDETFIAPED